MNPEAFSTWLHTAPANRSPLVMGVLNITPDSFSDGGQLPTVEAAISQARLMIEHGADLLDIGGESTRPGSLPVTEDEQIRRVVPVIAAIRQKFAVTISIDTTRGQVASAALDNGANVVNDVSAGRDDTSMLTVVADRKVPVILMHIRGTPMTMQSSPSYQDVVTEVVEFLRQRMQFAQNVGIDLADILLDPGIGFGKTVQHNLTLLNRLEAIAALGQPVVIGTSRKGFIAKVTGEGEPDDRLFGTAATVAWAVANGAGIVRVHDVEPMAKVVRMVQAIRKAGE